MVQALDIIDCISWQIVLRCDVDCFRQILTLTDCYDKYTLLRDASFYGNLRDQHGIAAAYFRQILLH